MSNIIQIDNIGCLYTANEDGVQSYKNTTITIEDGLIRSIGEKNEDKSIDCNGKMVTAGFVDSHTHPVFFENRANEYSMRLSGLTYQEIATNGGGIISSVNGVRNATEDE